MGIVKGFKGLIFTAALIAMLSGAPTTLVHAEGQSVTEETQVQLIDMFKVGYEIKDAVYSNATEYHYVSDDGKKDKWEWCYLSEIDGLKRTAEPPRDVNGEYTKGEKCDVKEPHVHGYYNLAEGYIMPFDCEDNRMTALGFEWLKTRLITKIDAKAMDVLHDFCLYRVVDNLIFMQTYIDYVQENGYYGFVFQIPTKIIGNSIELDGVAFTGTEPYYDESMDGYLYSYDYAFYEDEPKKEEQLHFTLTRTERKTNNK